MRIAGFLAANDKQRPFGARKTAASPLLLGRVDDAVDNVTFGDRRPAQPAASVELPSCLLLN